MILHLAPDEKFIDAAIALFEGVAPQQNHYVVWLEPGFTKPQFVKSTENVRCIPKSEAAQLQILSNLSNYKAVILHGLDGFAAELVNLSPVKTRFLWLALGFDIYTAFPHFPWRVYQRHTRNILREMRGGGRLSECRAILSATLFRSRLAYSVIVSKRLQAISRIQHCATVLPEEHVAVRALDFKGQFLRFNYGWIESMVTDVSISYNDLGRNILVGNSSTPTCNHVDIFRRLSHLQFQDRKVIVPLSYGDFTYRNHVIRSGDNIFNEAFSPLADFVPINVYNSVLRSCSIVVMNHLRQQAMGNIIASLHMGAKVFLNERNPAYSFLKHIGATIFSLQKDFDSISRSIESILPEQAASNKRCINSEYSWEMSLKRTRDVVDLLMAG